MSEENKVNMDTIPIQPNMVPMTNKSMLEEGDQLFYELGYKINIKKEYGDNWVRTGKFKEIKNPMEFKDPLLSEEQFLKHHNFMIIKGNKPQYTPGTFSKESVDKALKNTKDPMFFMDEATRNEINDRMMEDLSPIGLKPLWLNKEARYIEIKEAINRYNQAKKSVPQEWIDELNETEEWIKNWRKSKK